MFIKIILLLINIDDELLRLINIISNTVLLIDTINLLVMQIIDFLPLWKTAIVSKSSAEQDSFDLRPESSVASEVTRLSLVYLQPL